MDKQLETERLILRQFRESDLDAYAELYGDPEIMRYVGEFKPLDRDASWRSMATTASTGKPEPSRAELAPLLARLPRSARPPAITDSD